MTQTPHPRNASLLTRYLSNHDEPCPSCTYNLRGIGSTACPECNQPLRLIVSTRFPRIGVLIAGTIILACGLGFNLLVVIYGIVRVLDGFSPTKLGLFFAFTLCGAVVCGFCMWWWLRLRSTLVLWRPRTCALALALCALVTIVCTVPIFIFVD